VYEELEARGGPINKAQRALAATTPSAFARWRREYIVFIGIRMLCLSVTRGRI
jgi:hypothetical protein